MRKTRFPLPRRPFLQAVFILFLAFVQSGLALDLPSDSKQLVVVLTDNWGQVSGEASLWEQNSGKWKRYRTRFPAVVGSSGMAWGRGILPERMFGDTSGEPLKREGDKRAPAGIFRLVSAFGRSEEASSVMHMPFNCLTEETEAIDDQNSTHYNRIVERSQVRSRDWLTSEKMFQMGDIYRLGLIVGHNWDKPLPGEGSCIFVHTWRSSAKGTNGCTAFSYNDVQDLTSWLDSRKKPLLIQMPRFVLRRLGKRFSDFAPPDGAD
jgi:D-alanyl-D-alanine dipeptidase